MTPQIASRVEERRGGRNKFEIEKPVQLDNRKRMERFDDSNRFRMEKRQDFRKQFDNRRDFRSRRDYERDRDRGRNRYFLTIITRHILLGIKLENFAHYYICISMTRLGIYIYHRI